MLMCSLCFLLVIMILILLAGCAVFMVVFQSTPDLVTGKFRFIFIVSQVIYLTYRDNVSNEVISFINILILKEDVIFQTEMLYIFLQ